MRLIDIGLPQSNKNNLEQFCSTRILLYKNIWIAVSMNVSWNVKLCWTKLLTNFLIGAQTGQKVNAASVACSMVSARDTNGDRLFTSAEFLTGQQITSYFSRLASTRKGQGYDSAQSQSNDEDDEGVEAEVALTELREEVLLSIQPVHLLSHDSYNLCELMEKGKLSKFAIKMLGRICHHFDIPTCDIKERRKAPYLSRIKEFLKKYSCQQS